MPREDPVKGWHRIEDDLKQSREEAEEAFVKLVELYLAKVTELQRRYGT